MRYFFIFLCFYVLASCNLAQKNIQKSRYHHQIAVGLIEKCSKPRALAHLLQAVKLHPKDFLVRHTLAIVYYSMGRLDKALLELKRILKTQPSFTEARVNLARIYIDRGEIEKSLKEIAIAEKDMTYPDYLKIVSQKALAHYKKGNYLNSKKWLTEALSLPNGKNCFSYLYLGRVETALKNFDQSEKFLKKALSRCKREKTVCGEISYEGHLALAELYIKKGDNNRAKYHLNLFLKKSKKAEEINKARELLKQIS